MKKTNLDSKKTAAGKNRPASSRGVSGKLFKRKIPADAAKAVISASDAHPQFQYHGGGVVHNPQVYSIFLGDWSTATSQTRVKRLNQFLKDLTGSNYMYILSQYGCGTSGDFIKSVFLPNTANTLCENDIHTLLQHAIDNRAIPEPVNHNNVYMVFLDDKTGVKDKGIDIVMCEAHSDNAFGYHNVFITAAGHPCNYAIIPGLTGACLQKTCGGNAGCSLKTYQTREQRQTQVISHEFSEMITNPTGHAWYDVGDKNENGDICNGTPGIIKVKGRTWTVQRMYSKHDDILSKGDNICVLPPSKPIPPLHKNIAAL